MTCRGFTQAMLSQVWRATQLRSDRSRPCSAAHSTRAAVTDLERPPSRNPSRGRPLGSVLADQVQQSSGRPGFVYRSTRFLSSFIMMQLYHLQHSRRRAVQVGHGPAEYLDVVVEITQPLVAAIVSAGAEKSTHLSGLVVMIDSKAAFARASAADRTHAALQLQDGVVLARGDPVRLLDMPMVGRRARARHAPRAPHVEERDERA